MDFSNILVSTDGPIGLIQLNRPKVLNALNGALMEQVGAAAEAFDQDESIHCLILYGSERAFSAGADIDEMRSSSPLDMIQHSWISRNFARLSRIAKPIIAAVSGYCLGGGLELAMTCDIILASESAQFGQPEISIGIMPGAGGTQRWTRTVGKARAMEIMLTGGPIDAQRALEWGIVNRVVPFDELLSEAKKLAATIASKPALAVRMAKDAVLKAQDLTLGSGLDYENRLFALLFGTEDQKEGMRAFIEKRKPQWKGR